MTENAPCTVHSNAALLWLVYLPKCPSTSTLENIRLEGLMIRRVSVFFTYYVITVDCMFVAYRVKSMSQFALATGTLCLRVLSSEGTGLVSNLRSYEWSYVLGDFESHVASLSKAWIPFI